jgi:hypothetical protein
LTTQARRPQARTVVVEARAAADLHTPVLQPSGPHISARIAQLHAQHTDEARHAGTRAGQRLRHGSLVAARRAKPSTRCTRQPHPPNRSQTTIVTDLVLATESMTPTNVPDPRALTTTIRHCTTDSLAQSATALRTCKLQQQAGINPRSVNDKRPAAFATRSMLVLTDLFRARRFNFDICGMSAAFQHISSSLSVDRASYACF